MKNCFFILTIVGVLLAWRTDRLHLSSKVQLLERKMALSNPEWQSRRQAIERLRHELDVNIDPTQLPHVLFALSDPDPIVRAHALEILEKLRLVPHQTIQDPELKNPRPEFAFWLGVINSARKNSDDWDAIKPYIERLSQGESDLPNPFE